MRLASALWVLLGLLLALPALSPAAYADPEGVRFQEIHVSNGAEPPLVGGVWSPAKLEPGRKYPLVVISHGGGASYQAHSDVAVALARAGFVAAAINHAGDTFDDQSRVIELWRRPQQLRRLTSYMLEEWPDHARLDAKRVGAFGFSNGGFTVLVTAGGKPDLSLIGPYCQANPDHDLCVAIKHAGFDASHLPIHEPPNAWVADPRVKAIAVAAPAFGFTFTPAGLSAVHIPIQMWRAADDRHQPNPYYEEAVRKALPASTPVEYHVIPLAGHFSFLQPCDPQLTASQPLICKDAPGFDRAAFHKAMNAEIVRFFREHLKPRGR